MADGSRPIRPPSWVPADEVIQVTLAGLGVVGRDVARLAARRESLSITGACSRNPSLIGKDLGALAGGTPSGVLVSATLEEALEAPSNALVLATASFLPEVAPDVRTALAAGRDVLTTSEEAAYPWIHGEDLAHELGELAEANDVTILGAGVNPGFVFDYLVAAASGAAWDVERIAVERTVSLFEFSEAILRRSGIGYTPEEFEIARARGVITGHIGLPQSMHLIGHALGRPIERIDSSIEPIVAGGRLKGRNYVVEAGLTAGFVQEYRASGPRGEWITARMVAHMDPLAAGYATRDTIEISGSVPLRLVAEPGFDAQTTVAAVIVNSLPRLLAAAPGWATVVDLPPARPAVAA